ncbi:unnamed protein product, partial [Oppiella nova]
RFNPPDVPTDKDTYYGKVWPYGPAAFPDFFKNETVLWWQGQVKNLHDTLPFDSLWFDMNEPSNFEALCPKNKLDYPPIRSSVIFSNNQLSARTLCMVTEQGEKGEYRHYDVHSMYGLTGLIATRKALDATIGKRGFVVT